MGRGIIGHSSNIGHLSFHSKILQKYPITCNMYLPNDSDKYVQQNKWNNDCSMHKNQRITDQRKLILTRQMLQVSEAKFLRDAGQKCNSSALKKPDVSVTKDLWSFYPGIKACECLPRAYFILTDKWKMYSRPISIVTTDWRVNKLMNTTLNLWCIVLHVLHAHRVLKNWDHHIIGNCTMAQGNLH